MHDFRNPCLHSSNLSIIFWIGLFSSDFKGLLGMVKEKKRRKKDVVEENMNVSIEETQGLVDGNEISDKKVKKRKSKHDLKEVKFKESSRLRKSKKPDKSDKADKADDAGDSDKAGKAGNSDNSHDSRDSDDSD